MKTKLYKVFWWNPIAKRYVPMNGLHRMSWIAAVRSSLFETIHCYTNIISVPFFKS